MAKFFLLSLTITALILHKGEAIKCWSCNSNKMGERGCADPFVVSSDNIIERNIFSRDCDQSTMLLNLIDPNALTIVPTEKVINNSGLVIVCYKLTGTSLGAPFVLRECAASMPNSPALTSCMYEGPPNQTGGHILTCDACSGDFCNGAAGGGTAAVLFVVTLLLMLA